ncbi:MAG: hypothetical protein J7L88_04435, partial [Thermoplasmata archaeon]|nr:hypothetical protein [Thermoplasmata archaeon]
TSNNYPVTSGAYSVIFNGGQMDLMITSLLVDLAGPIFVNDMSSPYATTGDDYTFSVKVIDNVQVYNVSVEYWFGNGTHTVQEMGKTGGSIWDLTITVPQTSLEPLHYIFYALDNSFNQNNTTQRDISVLDNDGPTFKVDGTLKKAFTGVAFSFSVVVTDNIKVSSVYVEYWFGDSSTHENVSMSPGVVDLWEHSIPIPENETGPLHYIFHANDTSNNWNETAQKVVSIQDIIPPFFGTDDTSNTATTGDNLTFSVYVYDNIMVSSVWLEYQYGDRIIHNLSMEKRTDGRWICELTIPDYTTETLFYSFHACDTSGNWNSTDTKGVTIVDNDPPVFRMDSTPTTATTGENLSFVVYVTDNIKVSGLWLEYWYGTSETHINTSMMYVKEELLWKYNITVPSDSLDPLHYLFHACDISGNWVNTTPKIITILDNDCPRFIEDNTPTNGTTGDAFTFSVVVEDNIGVQAVFVKYWYGDGFSSNDSMFVGSDNTWTATIYLPRKYLEAFYEFSAVDSSGNWAHTSRKKITVLDSIEPVLRTDGTTHNAYAGGKVTFSINVTDNIEVGAVYVEYWYGDNGEHYNISMKHVGGDSWVASITVKNTMEWITYIFHACDTAGNWARSRDEEMINVEDIEPPYIVAVDVPVKVTAGKELTLTVNASDNVGIDEVWAEYWFGNGTHLYIEMNKTDSEYACKIAIPSNFTGTMHVVFYAEDLAWNDASTSQYNITVEKVKRAQKKPYLLIGIAGGAAAVALAVAFLLIRKRRGGGPREAAEE